MVGLPKSEEEWKISDQQRRSAVAKYRMLQERQEAIESELFVIQLQLDAAKRIAT